MRIVLVVAAALCAIGLAACSNGGASVSSDELRADLGEGAFELTAHEPDLGILLHPETMGSYGDVPGADQLREVIRVGARALDWVDLLQKNVPEHEREQIWRRLDRVGKEATATSPLTYNPESIMLSFRKAIEAAPAAVADALQSLADLPAKSPEGITTRQVVESARAVHAAYSRASRWLVLYGWRQVLDRSSRDFRPWLKLEREREALLAMAERWGAFGLNERLRFIEDVAKVCPLAIGDSAVRCSSEAESLREPESGALARQWLERIHQRGRQVYEGRFGVLRQHEGVRLSVSDGYHLIEMPTYGIEPEMLAWIQARVDEAWGYKDSIGVRLFESPISSGGAVKVRWQKGALPNVNGIAGDVITMDANTPKWLEHTQAVMRHEFGHVLGFPDCYTEFWEEELGSFTYYSLDPTDAMCALSGEYSDRHRVALLKGYF